MWGGSLIALLFSSSRRGPSSGSCTFPPSFQVEVGLSVVPSKILLVMELSPCLSPQGNTWHFSLLWAGLTTIPLSHCPCLFFLGSLPHPPSFWARRLDTGHEISPGVSRERSFLLGVGVCLGDKRREPPGPHPGRAGLALWGLVVGGGKGQRGCYSLWGCLRFQALEMCRDRRGNRAINLRERGSMRPR